MSKIDVKDLKNIYKETKYLDELFHKQNDIRSKEIIEKNILELLVELGELANETRCFKYWSVKKPSEKDIILGEYIDCLFMTLYFSNITDLSLDEEFPKANNKELVEAFIDLYKRASLLQDELNKDKIKKILVDILYLGSLLDFNKEDLEKGTMNKSYIIQKRFKENY